MKEIPLTKGIIAFVDDEDYERVVQHTWYAWTDNRRFTWYARTVINGKTVSMHRFVMNLTPNDSGLDHINENGLDNRKENLRFANDSQQQQNRSKNTIRDTSSKYKGVTKIYGRKKCWRAQIQPGKLVFLGNYYTEEEAAHAYDKAAIEIFGEFAKTNF